MSDASLGFNVDSSQVVKAATDLDNMAKAATGATQAVDGLSTAASNLNKSGSSRGIMGNITRDFQTIINESHSVGEALEAEATKAEGFFSRITRGFAENHGAQREAMVLTHEVMSGRFSRMGSSLSIMLGNMGLGGAGGLLAVGGIYAAVEGVSALVNALGNASQAEQEFQVSAVVSSNYSLLDSEYIKTLYGQVNSATVSFQNFKIAVEDAINSGVSDKELNKPYLLAKANLESAISGLKENQKDEAQRNASALDKMFADPLSNFKQSFTELSKDMSQSQQDAIIGAAKAGKIDDVRLLMQKSITDEMNQQAAIYDHITGTDIKFQDKGYFQIAKEAILGLGDSLSMMWSGDTSKMWRNAMVSEQGTAPFKDAITKAKDAGRETELAINTAVQGLSKATHPLSLQHGLTDAEKAARALIQYQSEMKRASASMREQSDSIINSVNRAWGNKNFQYSMTSDQHDYLNRVDQLNQQFDRMRTNIDMLAVQHKKSIFSPEYVAMFQQLEGQRKAALAANETGFTQMLQHQQSVLSGMSEGWYKYEKTVNNVADQTAQVYDQSMDKMASSLTNFLETGKFEIDDFLKFVAEDIEKLFVNQFVMRPLNNLIGGWMGFNVGNGLDAMVAPVTGSTANGAMGLPTGYGGYGAVQNPNLTATPQQVDNSPISIVINNNGGNNVHGTSQGDDTKQAQSMARHLQKAMQDFVKQQNTKSNQQGGTNKTMGNWSTN